MLQTIDLYGTRYGVGLRDIPAGHACGVAWDGFVDAGWVKSAFQAAGIQPAPGASAGYGHCRYPLPEPSTGKRVCSWLHRPDDTNT